MCTIIINNLRSILFKRYILEAQVGIIFSQMYLPMLS